MPRDLPKFVAPKPLPYENIDTWHRRVVNAFESFVNDDLTPALERRFCAAEQEQIPWMQYRSYR